MKRAASRPAAWLFGAFFCLYALTAQRGVAWQDSGVFQLRIVYRDLAGYFGLASAHPLYIRLAHAFSLLCDGFFDIEAPVSANIFSAACMAASVAALFSAALELTGSRRVSILAAAGFGCSHMAWWLATIAESYPLSLLFIGLEFLYAVRILKYGPSVTSTLCLAAFAGFGFDVHNLSLLSLPISLATVAAAPFLRHPARDDAAPGLFHRAASSLRDLLLFAAVWTATSGLAGKMAIARPSSLGAFISDLLFGDYAREVLGLSAVPLKVTLANLAIVSLSAISPFWIAAAVAAARRLRGLSMASPRRLAPPAPYRLLAPALFAIHAAFLLHYRIADQALFALPSLFFAAATASILLARSRHLAPLAMATALSAFAVPLAANLALHMEPLRGKILASRPRLLPFRDEIRYWTLPWKHNENSAERFAAAAIAKMNHEGGSPALFADNTSAPPIMLRISDASPSWTLFTPWDDVSRFVAGCRDGRPSFAVSPVSGYCPAAALSTGKLMPLLPPGGATRTSP